MCDSYLEKREFLRETIKFLESFKDPKVGIETLKILTQSDLELAGYSTERFVRT